MIFESLAQFKMTMSSHILLTGGAGYIGSHMALMLKDQGYQPIVIDLKNNVCLEKNNIPIYIGDIGDQEFVLNILKKVDFKINAVMHFAGVIEVGESVINPIKYYEQNFSRTLNLLEVLIKNNIKKFIFSSTAAIFGEPEYTPINELHPKKPLNPYGQSKLFVENSLKDLDQSLGLKSVCLRYFNAAGADPKLRTGESHNPETHLIPLVLQAALGVRKNIKIFGDDYETPDGSCIRDFIHVEDLCAAHLLALKYLDKNNQSNQFNLGNSHGTSVKEIIEIAQKITGKNIPVEICPRRAGDPKILIADNQKAKKILGWEPRYTHMEEIIQHAWGWISQ